MKSLHIGISALHVRPGRSGSHEPYMINLVRALSGLGSPHRYTIYVTPANRECFEVDDSRFDLVVYPSLCERMLPRIACEQFVIPVDVVQREIDVMHYAGTAGSVFMRHNDVVTIHHDSVTSRFYMSWLRNLYYDAVLRANRRAGLLIAPSKVYADELVDYYGYRPEQMRAVHHGVNPAFLPQPSSAVQKTRQERGGEPNAVLTVTNTLPHKNIPTLLRAFQLLLSLREVNSQLVMVGNLSSALIERIVGEIATDPTELRSRIQLIPFLPNDQLPPIYGASAAFVSLSLVESFGMCLVEAMACGLPIVASDIPVHREVLQGAGLIVSPHDPGEIASALADVLTDGQVRNRLRRAALERSRSFSWRKTAQRTVEVYEEVWRLAQRKHSGRGSV